MSSLRYLAGRGDPFELLAALDGGADPNVRGKGGKTPLMAAAKHDNRVAARLLLERGAEIDAIDDEGETALVDASELKMKRLLLDAGADPDGGRTGKMNLLAFFASFRNRELVDLFLAYGANPDEMTHKGPSVRTMLDDPDFVWAKPPMTDMNTPERRAGNAKAILKLSDGLRLTPEAYVAENRNILIWSFGAYPYDDAALDAWAKRVSDLLASPVALEAAYRAQLHGETLDAALRSLVRPKQRAERERLRQARMAEFEAVYFGGEGVH